MTIFTNMTNFNGASTSGSNGKDKFTFDEDREDPDIPPVLAEKRRRNMLAARRSRKRKILYVMWLESRARELQQQLEGWKARAAAYEEIMQENGLTMEVE